MTESKICTCPSGDGSLRWPCPKHPAVEQAGTNVGHGHVFPRADGVKMRCGGPGLCSECAADAYRARAALAQPSPVQELDFSKPLETENGDPVKWICADVIEYKSARICVAQDTGLVYSSPYIGLKIRNVIPEQAEAERPEFDESEREDMARIAFETAMANGISLDSFTFLSNSLAERYERIVGELRAVIAQLRQHKNDYMDSGQQTYRALQNEIREREAEIARLDGLVSGRTAERDAALARVAELEKQEPVALANRGLHAFWVKWTEAAAGLYGPGIKLYANPVAQAQHSVPEVTGEMVMAAIAAFRLDAPPFKSMESALNAALRKAAAPGKEGV
ncbi:hypothetical protein [Pseudomonas aeruginosa]|uniref:hypothetical protein n=1 Tax=Pseudomonas aeruginosa TaxID=287 RepID=UPI00163BD23C|nr:hypothetical protein [Pseudomonas aeruginosa]